MNEAPRFPQVDDLPQEMQELNPEQAESAEGGFIVIGGRSETPEPHLHEAELLPYIEQENLYKTG